MKKLFLSGLFLGVLFGTSSALAVSYEWNWVDEVCEAHYSSGLVELVGKGYCKDESPSCYYEWRDTDDECVQCCRHSSGLLECFGALVSDCRN